MRVRISESVGVARMVTAASTTSPVMDPGAACLLMQETTGSSGPASESHGRIKVCQISDMAVRHIPVCVLAVAPSGVFQIPASEGGETKPSVQPASLPFRGGGKSIR